MADAATEPSEFREIDLNAPAASVVTANIGPRRPPVGERAGSGALRLSSPSTSEDFVPSVYRTSAFYPLDLPRPYRYQKLAVISDSSTVVYRSREAEAIGDCTEDFKRLAQQNFFHWNDRHRAFVRGAAAD
jgi:hypothetical protein